MSDRAYRPPRVQDLCRGRLSSHAYTYVGFSSNTTSTAARRAILRNPPISYPLYYVELHQHSFRDHREYLGDRILQYVRVLLLYGNSVSGVSHINCCSPSSYTTVSKRLEIEFARKALGNIIDLLGYYWWRFSCFRRFTYDMMFVSIRPPHCSSNEWYKTLRLYRHPIQHSTEESILPKVLGNRFTQSPWK